MGAGAGTEFTGRPGGRQTGGGAVCRPRASGPNICPVRAGDPSAAPLYVDAGSYGLARADWGNDMMSETRKLAAILAADVVGFSRLAGADEDRTLARLRALRSDLIDPTIAVHNGRVIKRMGDGFLVEFRSVVDAVRCAIELQNSMVERNAGLPPERAIVFRIGVHLGDVVEEADGDLMGDGVNIAARLEGIAKPGAVCLSEDAYRQVRTRLDFAVSDLGHTQLKNIAEQVRVYSLEVGIPAQAKPASEAAAAAPAKPAAPPVSHKPSIAVLAFNNMSGDIEQEYFSDGISEDIITDLSTLSELHVVARNSSFIYKKVSVSAPDVAKALGRALRARRQCAQGRQPRPRAVVTRVLDRRGRDPQVHLTRARVAQHLHDLARGIATYDRVVDHDQTLATDDFWQRVELKPQTVLAQLLAGLDEGPRDVTVLDEAVILGQPRLAGQPARGGVARVRHRDHKVRFHRLLRQRIWPIRALETWSRCPPIIESGRAK